MKRSIQSPHRKQWVVFFRSDYSLKADIDISCWYPPKTRCRMHASKECSHSLRYTPTSKKNLTFQFNCLRVLFLHWVKINTKTMVQNEIRQFQSTIETDLHLLCAVELCARIVISIRKRIKLANYGECKTICAHSITSYINNSNNSSSKNCTNSNNSCSNYCIQFSLFDVFDWFQLMICIPMKCTFSVFSVAFRSGHVHFTLSPR